MSIQLDILESTKDLIEIAKSKNPNFELLFRDAYKRGFIDGMKAENERIIERITNKKD